VSKLSLLVERQRTILQQSGGATADLRLRITQELPIAQAQDLLIHTPIESERSANAPAASEPRSAIRTARSMMIWR
jgi:hypothetical protein